MMQALAALGLGGGAEASAGGAAGLLGTGGAAGAGTLATPVAGSMLGAQAGLPSILQQLGPYFSQFGQGIGQGLFGAPQNPNFGFRLGNQLSSSLTQPKPDASGDAAAGGQYLQQQMQQKLAQLHAMGLI